MPQAGEAQIADRIKFGKYYANREKELLPARKKYIRRDRYLIGHGKTMQGIPKTAQLIYLDPTTYARIMDAICTVDASTPRKKRVDKWRAFNHFINRTIDFWFEQEQKLKPYELFEAPEETKPATPEPPPRPTCEEHDCPLLDYGREWYCVTGVHHIRK